MHPGTGTYGNLEPTGIEADAIRSEPVAQFTAWTGKAGGEVPIAGEIARGRNLNVLVIFEIGYK